MTRFTHFKIVTRVQIARSLHAIASVIGIESADSDLVPIFRRYARDIPDVQDGLLHNLYEFFQNVSPNARESLAEDLVLFHTCESQSPWRNLFMYIE